MSEGIPLNIKCSNCGADIPPADASGVVRCAFCQHTFRSAAPKPERVEVVRQVVVQVPAPQPVAQAKRTSPVVQIVLGCGGLVLLGFFGLVVLGLMVGPSHKGTPQTVPPRASTPTTTPQVPYTPPAIPSQPSYPTPTPAPTRNPTQPAHYPVPSRSAPQPQPQPQRGTQRGVPVHH